MIIVLIKQGNLPFDQIDVHGAVGIRFNAGDIIELYDSSNKVVAVFQKEYVIGCVKNNNED